MTVAHQHSASRALKMFAELATAISFKKNHPLDLFGDIAKDERIVADIEKMNCHHVHVGPVMLKYQKFRRL